MDAVEGAGEDEVVVCREGGGAGEAEGTGCGGWSGGGEGGGGGDRECPVVDERAGFGDYEEGEDGHFSGGKDAVIRGCA